MPRRFAALLLLSALLAASSTPLPSQDIRIDLTRSTAEMPACPGSELIVTARIQNPSGREIGGYQLFLRFSAAHFAVDRIEPLAIDGFVEIARPVDGFSLACDGDGDPWGDRQGEDMVAIMASAYRVGGAGGFRGLEADLCRFVFRPLGVSTEGSGGASFTPNRVSCRPPLDQVTKVFAPDGSVLSEATSEAFSVKLATPGPFVRDFTCSELGDRVVLTWTAPESGTFTGYRVYRDGVRVFQTVGTFLSEYTDTAPPAGTVRYELAVFFAGDLEGCRESCTLARARRFLRGDADQDQRISLTDAIFLLSHLFQGGPSSCEDAGDFDDNGKLDTTDALQILAHLFLPEKPALHPPFGSPGVDPTEDRLTCGP